MRSNYYLVLPFITFALAAANSVAKAEPASLGPMPAQVERVIDGDTVKMRVAIWIDQEVVVSVRLAGVDAPELFRPECDAEKALAIKAKTFVEDFLSDGSAVLHDIERDKYGGRVVARIVGSKGDLGDALIAAGLAVEGLSDAWCPAA